MREYREVLSGGRPRANLGQLRRSLSQAKIYLEGVRGPARVAEIGGDRGDWTVVRSRKRKATQPEAGRRDRSRVSERQGEAVRVRDKRGYGDSDRETRLYDGN